MLREQARDALVFTGSTFLNRLGGFLLVPLYWRRLSPADYGVVAVIAILGSFQSLVSAMSLDLSVTRFFYQWSEQDRRKNLGAIWVWSSLSTCAWCGVFLLVMPHISRFLFPEVSYHPYLRLGIIGNALSNLFVIPATTIRIKRLPWLFASQNLISLLLTTGLGLWLVVVRDEKLVGYLTSTILANASMAVLGAAMMLTFSRPALSSPGLREALRFSLPAIPSSLIGVTSSMLDRFLLNYYSSLETLGLYAISMSFVDIMNQLHSSLKMAYGPFMMKEISEDPEAGKPKVAAVTAYYMLPYFVAGLGLILFIGPLVHLINRPAYFAVVDWVPWLTGLSVLSCSSAYYANGLVLGRRTDLLSVPAMVQLAVLVPASMLLIRPYQLAGLVIGRYLSTGAFVAVGIYLSQKIYPLPHRWGSLAAMALSMMLFAACSHYLELSSLLFEIGSKLVLLAVFAAVAYVLVWLGPRAGLRSALARVRAKVSP